MQRQALRWRARCLRVGFVPTMGCLHRGHLSLVNAARQSVGRAGVVVVSIYVNPTQFSPSEDLRRYPRNLRRDLQLCRQAGVDLVFAPADREMYGGDASGAYSAYVVEEQFSRPLEGQSRPTHFRGVATVVAKLFNIVLPSVAVFGAKDYQQAQVIKRLVRDLNFPVDLVVAPTVREPDGLALSSRNTYLSSAQRTQALVLYECLQHACRAVRTSRGGLSAAMLRRRIRALVGRYSEARLDYVEFFHPDTLEVVRQVRRGSHMALAVFVGSTRLIDNGRLE
jgi:pantoate--beta-alanine ligase